MWACCGTYGVASSIPLALIKIYISLSDNISCTYTHKSLIGRVGVQGDILVEPTLELEIPLQWSTLIVQTLEI